MHPPHVNGGLPGRPRSGVSRADGFTLIELLIVIAIILILVAIALPNFLEAQIRARVVKAKGEIRSIGIAMESYFLDFKTYPPESEHDIRSRGRFEAGLTWLTTPIVYIAALPEDPFGEPALRGEILFYEMGGIQKGGDFQSVRCPQCNVTWAVFTRGPDSAEGDVDSANPHWVVGGDRISVDSFSPTNGTRSAGDIFLYGGDPFWIGVRLDTANLAAYRANAGAFDVGLVVDNEVYLHRMPPSLR